MKNKLTHLILVLAIFISTPSFGQFEENNEAGFWFTMTNKFQVNDNLYFLNVAQLRQVEFMKSTRIWLLMPTINYKPTSYLIVGAGYGYLDFLQKGIRPPSLDYEHRAVEHFTLLSKFGATKMNQRFMFEQRWRTNLKGATSYQNRFRYRINLDFTLFSIGNNKEILGRLSEELRIRFDSGFNGPTFDQNNFMALFGYKLRKNSKIYAGYGRDLYQSGNGTFWGDHLLQVWFNYDFDFRKRK